LKKLVFILEIGATHNTKKDKIWQNGTMPIDMAGGEEAESKKNLV